MIGHGLGPLIEIRATSLRPQAATTTGTSGTPGALNPRLQHRIGFGAFADVFRDPESGRVYELFKASINQLGDPGEHEPILRSAAFNSERQAYEVAMGVNELRPFIPAYHGIVEIEQVLDGAENVSDRYPLDCCYIIDYVDNSEPAELTPNLAQ